MLDLRRFKLVSGSSGRSGRCFKLEHLAESLYYLCEADNESEFHAWVSALQGVFDAMGRRG